MSFVRGVPLLLGASHDDDAQGMRDFHRRVTREIGRDQSDRAEDQINLVGEWSTAELFDRLDRSVRTALTVLYDALFDPLWRIAVLQTRSAEAAKDIVHDVFLWLWTRRESVSPAVDLRVYLAAATRNRARDLARHAKVVEAAVDARKSDPQPLGLGRPSDPTDLRAEDAEFRAAYRQALTLLTERESTVALLRWEEEFTLEQIAEVVGISRMGVLGVVRRVQEKLRGALKEFR
jgi:RNA polymerase sigma factor (sigma-70 family)